jgi:hypothetical protein
MSDGWLYAAQLAFSIGSKITDYNDQVTAGHIDFANKQRQAALNNNLAYNAYVNLNEQQLLDNTKYKLDEFELKKQIRRVVATQLARDGSVLKSGGSANSVLMNIHRQGLQALHRKEFNFHTKLRNLKIQRDNIALETQSKNNALFNSLKGFPSATGLALSIGGSALQTGINYKKGRQQGSYLTTTTKDQPIAAPLGPQPNDWNYEFGNWAREGTPSSYLSK